MKLNLLLIIGFSFIYCNNSKLNSKGINTIYYKDFDIFNLKGFDTLNGLDKNHSVEVRYEGDKPVYIKYYKPKRVILLLLSDSFSIDDKQVQVYYTSNFKGGPPGRHKVYFGRSEEFKHLVYVSNSDTLLVETKHVPPTGNFLFDLFVKDESGRISMVTAGEIDYDEKNKKLINSQLYSKWFAILQEKYKSNISDHVILKELPPN